MIPAVMLSGGASGLGATRALARKGVPVIAIMFDPQDELGYSRYPKEKIFIEADSIAEQDEKLLDTLLSMPWDGYALLPSSDHMLDFMSTHRERLREKYTFELVDEELLAALNDKQLETVLMESHGFAIPKTIQHLPDSAKVLGEQLRLPIIFKPKLFSVKEVFPHKNLVVYTEQELDKAYLDWGHIMPQMIAQEVIPGPDSFCWVTSGTYSADHKLLHCGIKQKLRAQPAHFGGSCYAVSKHNSDVFALAKSLGKALKYSGHAGIEFRWDARDEQYKYIELNPRFPANVGFDQACGLETVWNSYQVSIGGNDFVEPKLQKDGVYFVNIWADFYSQRTDQVGVLRILFGFLGLLFRRTDGMYFSWRDPLPGIVHTLHDVVRIAKTAINKISKQR